MGSSGSFFGGEGHVNAVTTNMQQSGSARYHCIFGTVEGYLWLRVSPNT